MEEEAEEGEVEGPRRPLVYQLGRVTCHLMGLKWEHRIDLYHNRDLDLDLKWGWEE